MYAGILDTSSTAPAGLPATYYKHNYKDAIFSPDKHVVAGRKYSHIEAIVN
ncbi:hypothetical protein GCM10027443_38470 [Pontibacter brevis]